MWATPQFKENGEERTVVMSRSQRFAFDSQDRKTYKDRLRLRKEASVRVRQMARTQRKPSDEDPLQTQALQLLDVLSDTNQAVSNIIDKTAKQHNKGEVQELTRGKRLPLDKALTATIQYANECHHYVLDFPEMPIACLLRIEIKRRMSKGPEVQVYVGRQPVPTPSAFDWHCPCESSLTIDPEDPLFHHGLYWITVYSLGKNAEYTIHCKSMVYREQKSADHDKKAVKLLSQNIKRRVAQSEEIRLASQKELKQVHQLKAAIQDEPPDPQLFQKFQEFEWLQATMEPYDFRSRAVTVKNYRFNPVRMRDAIVQIQEALTEDSTAKQRYNNAAVDALGVAEVFVSQTFKTFPRFRPSSAMARPQSPSPASPTRSRPSTALTPKADTAKYRSPERKMVIPTSKGKLPASFLWRLRADHIDYRTHSFERFFYRMSNFGNVLQSASDDEQAEGATVFEVKEILSAEAVALDDQPSVFFCFKLALATSTIIFAADSEEDRLKWLRAAALFTTAEKPFSRISSDHSHNSRSRPASSDHTPHVGRYFGAPTSPSRAPGSPSSRVRSSGSEPPASSSSPAHHRGLLIAGASSSPEQDSEGRIEPSSNAAAIGGRQANSLASTLTTVGSELVSTFSSPRPGAQTVVGDVHPRRPFSATSDHSAEAGRGRRPATAMQ